MIAKHLALCQMESFNGTCKHILSGIFLTCFQTLPLNGKQPGSQNSRSLSCHLHRSPVDITLLPTGGSTTSIFSIEKHVQWSSQEKKCILANLGHLIRAGRVPNKKECEDCKAKGEGALDRRDWRAVKFWVKNQITKRKKKIR